MDESILRIYTESIALKQSDPVYSKITDMISNAQEQTNIQLRSDAIYFLANSLFDLVVSPLKTAMNREIEAARTLTESDLLGLAEKDLMIVIRRAAILNKQDGNEKISGSTAIVALGQSIRNLSLDDLQVWG